MQIQAGKKVNKIATVLDEAFVLLVLENIWSDMEKVNIDDYYRQKKEKRNNDDNSEGQNAAGDETNNGDRNDNVVGNKLITGKWMSGWRGSRCWNSERLNHFNKLVKMVQQDRENDMHFQAQYEIWLNEGKNKKQKEKAKHPIVQAY